MAVALNIKDAKFSLSTSGWDEDWDKMKKCFLCSIFGDESATVHCIPSDPKDSPLNDLNDEEINFTKSVINGESYHSAYCSSWKTEDLDLIASSMEFELCSMWLAFSSEENPAEEFFKFVDKVNVPENTNRPENLSTVGCVSDGLELIWFNPLGRKVEQVKDAIINFAQNHDIDIEHET